MSAPVVQPTPPSSVAGPASPEADRRQELASFLRSRRERIRPEEVGLPPGGRRRTPGLRREEVAQLAGVGVTWYTWLEQGRDINVSAQVVDAIARTLRLSRPEWSHLALLAGTSPTTADPGCAALSPVTRAAVDALDPLPALVLNDRYDILAHNAAYSRAVTDVDALPVHERNLVFQAFTRGRICDVMVDPDTARARMVAALRAAAANHFGDSSWQRFIAGMQSASPQFADLWERHDVAPVAQQTKRVLHPELGTLTFETANLYPQVNGHVRVVVYAPADEETRQKLERLAEQATPPSRPGG
ncbi:XRE family transcriptional regulator [Nocardioides mangrovicus]|uniref:XRE family transcriptional regulator n=1 Tax=Nocardioides mangrovicus TaxID=2478913 RepID=A0A3L8P3G9_9ACTN|nr:helix-turn-helix transcriptional regulator [Nocardioides mangrovicus]RLV49631.1 XRE family transcriptional regulator [Nocardioides mangrovicus]